jgi:hypothetical protein
LIVCSLLSCGQDKQKENQMNSDDGKGCFYSYNHSSSVLEWTAFKFTEKTGVKGTFNEIIVETPQGSDEPVSVLQGLKFKIPTSTVETQNEERNGKISGIFFKTFLTDTIRGSIKKIDLTKGTAAIVIEMNGKSKDVTGQCSLVKGQFSFTSSIDVNDWNGSEAIKALNTACKDLHTGADGKSVLWSTIDLSFKTELMSDCN